jgi:homospermidine synthase
MKYLKYFNQIIFLIESIINFDKLNEWIIHYNHGKNHDLDERLIRAKMSEDNFNKLLNKIIDSINRDNLVGDYIFYSIEYGSKIVVNINFNKKVLYVVTILNKKHNTKTNNIKIIT